MARGWISIPVATRRVGERRVRRDAIVAQRWSTRARARVHSGPRGEDLGGRDPFPAGRDRAPREVATGGTSRLRGGGCEPRIPLMVRAGAVRVSPAPTARAGTSRVRSAGEGVHQRLPRPPPQLERLDAFTIRSPAAALHPAWHHGGAAGALVKAQRSSRLAADAHHQPAHAEHPASSAGSAPRRRRR